MLRELALYVALTSAIAFVLMGFDKHRAQRGRRRVRERTLLGVAAVGGTVGLVAGMLAFHHKVRKGRFVAWVAAISGAQSLALVWLVGQGLQS